MQNIYDCVTYFNEDLLLKIRMEILNKYVDKFVIIESSLNHRGVKKKKNFNINKFKKFKKKIIYHFIKDTPQKKINELKNNQWVLENYQRNQIIRGLKECKDNDLIIISDADEIPNPNKIKEFKERKKIGIFLQKLFYYKFNLKVLNQKYWQGSRILLKKNLTSPQKIRMTKKIPFYSIKRYLKKNYIIINNGGWHFSYLGNAKKIKEKISSYGHREYDISSINNLKTLDKKIKANLDILNRNYIFQKIELNNKFPEYIIRNKNKLKKYIL